MEILQPQPAQLGHPQPAGIQRLHDEAVPDVAARPHQLADLVGRQRLRGLLDTAAAHDPAVPPPACPFAPPDPIPAA